MSKSFIQQYIYYKYIDLSHGDLFNKKIITIYTQLGPNTSKPNSSNLSMTSDSIGALVGFGETPIVVVPSQSIMYKVVKS